LKVNVSLSQISWKAVPQFRTCSCKTPVSIFAEGPSQHTSLMWQNTQHSWRRPLLSPNHHTANGLYALFVVLSVWRSTISQCWALLLLRPGTLCLNTTSQQWTRLGQTSLEAVSVGTFFSVKYYTLRIAAEFFVMSNLFYYTHSQDTGHKNNYLHCVNRHVRFYVTNLPAAKSKRNYDKCPREITRNRPPLIQRWQHNDATCCRRLAATPSATRQAAA